MKYIRFLFLIWSFTSVEIFAQPTFRKLKLRTSSTGEYSKGVLAIEAKNHDCVRINVKIFSQRIKDYPFNMASQIQFVSFEGLHIPVLNDTICYSKLKEIKNLTLKQIDSLTDILYNVGFGGTIFIKSIKDCYEPRNAILFVDSAGKAFAYIEICFECEQFVVSTEQIKFGDICNQKFSLLKKQFRNAGIQYGTKN